MLRETIRYAARESVLETSPHYRTAIGVFGITLPAVLIVGGRIRGVALQSSLSAYYHTKLGGWFIGTLFVIGVFLFFYKYVPPAKAKAKTRFTAVKTGHADAWLGKVAGVCALVVALYPTSIDGIATPTSQIHFAAACALFFCLALFPLMLFSHSRTRPATYLFYGWSMLIVLAAGAIYAFTTDDFKNAVKGSRPLLVIETTLILLFGLSWFQKGRDLAQKAKQVTPRSAA